MVDQGRAKMGAGVVKSWFNGDGGYGFILPEGGGEPVFAHHTRIAPQHTRIAPPHTEARSLKQGARVSYEVAREKMAGLWAQNIHLTDQ